MSPDKGVVDLSKLAAAVAAEIGNIDVAIFIGVELKTGILTLGSASPKIVVTEAMIAKICERAIAVIREN